MFKKILVPTDGSDLSEKAIYAAVEFAHTNGSEIIAISVAEPYVFGAFAEGSIAIPVDPWVYEERVLQLAQQHVEKVAEVARARNVPCQITVAKSFNPYEEIIEAAKRFHCDVIFMASHGRKGLNKLFVGSETQKVLAYSTIPVMVFR
jgi:nucleotide-binding universal stress UspA family protein